MRWVFTFYAGSLGWLAATGQIGVWAAGWLKSAGWLLLVPLVLIGMVTCECWLKPIAMVVEDIEQFSERKTGRKNGWLFKFLAAGIIAWLLPWILVLGGSLAGGR